MHDVQYRKDVAERVGVGFDVPARLNSRGDLAQELPELDLDGLNSNWTRKQRLQ
jgi:hypothetical protein